MNIKELEAQRVTAEGIISISDDLIGKLSENDRVIGESRAAADAIANVSTSINETLKRAITEMNSESVEKSTATLRTLLAWLDERVLRSNLDATRLEGTQEGMRRALEAVKQTGSMRIAEIDRIIELASSEDEPRRATGERPEKLAVKRKAAELRKEQDT
jgi:hypothetical protein